MRSDFIYLTTEKQIRIYMFPLRQKILKLMNLEGKPMTAKQIADQLSITPSSAKHHILKLEEISLVTLDHQELINGISASYYKTTGKNVSIGQNFNDAFSAERDAYVKNNIYRAYNDYQSLVNANRQNKTDAMVGDLISGIVHLTDKQAREIHDVILEFMQKNRESNAKTNPWSFTILAYNSTDISKEPHL